MTAASQLRGDISPLTPPRHAQVASPTETPPLPGDESPRTPPFPPPIHVPLMEDEVSAAFQPHETSPVSDISDTDFVSML